MSQGILFDMDGVLVASGPAHQASWRVLARKHGLEVSKERFAETFGRPSRDIIRIIWGEQVSDEQIREIDDAKESIYRDLISGMVPLTIGTRELLGMLAEAGFRMAIATSGPRENIELVLRETRLQSFFAATVSGFDIQHGKPAPDCFLLAAERIGCAPRDCVVVEDAPVGVEAARAAGMKCIALTGTHPAERLQQSQPDRIVSSLREVTPRLIAELLNGAA